MGLLIGFGVLLVFAFFVDLPGIVSQVRSGGRGAKIGCLVSVVVILGTGYLALRPFIRDYLWFSRSGQTQAVENLYDSERNIVARVKTDGNGTQRIYDARGHLLFYYRPDQDVTYDASNKAIARGNQIRQQIWWASP